MSSWPPSLPRPSTQNPVGCQPPSASWCQGLAGIATSLLTAAEYLNEANYRAAARRAADACIALIPRMDKPTQCCGLAGIGTMLIPRDITRDRDKVARINKVLAEQLNMELVDPHKEHCVKGPRPVAVRTTVRPGSASMRSRWSSMTDGIGEATAVTSRVVSTVTSWTPANLSPSSSN